MQPVKRRRSIHSHGSKAMEHAEVNNLTEPAYREIIAPGGRWSRKLETGELLRIVDLEGQQAVDFLCYSAELPLDRLNVPNTVKLNRSLYVTKGTTLYSDRARKMFSVLED